MLFTGLALFTLLYSTCILTLSTTAILQFLSLEKRLRPGHLYPRSLHKRQCAGLLHLGRDPFVRKVHRHYACDKRSQSLHRLERGTFDPLETRAQQSATEKQPKSNQLTSATALVISW